MRKVIFLLLLSNLILTLCSCRSGIEKTSDDIAPRIQVTAENVTNTEVFSTVTPLTLETPSLVLDFIKIYEPVITGWKLAYENVINGDGPYSEGFSFCFYNGDSLESTKAYYAFYDIDGNGIPELILRKECEYEDIIAYIFSIKDGIAVNIFGYDDMEYPREVPWSRDGSSFLLNNGFIDSINGNYTIYSISGDGCSVTEVASCEPYDYPDEAGLAEAKWRFYINGTQVEYDEYVQYLSEQGYAVDGSNTLATIEWENLLVEPTQAIP